MSETTQTTTESDGVLDTLEAKLYDFEERIGLHTVTGRMALTKGAMYYAAAMLFVGPAAAQGGNIGSTLCGTDLMQFISNLLGILLTIGFLAGMYAVARSGIQYMNAGGDPEKKSKARESLVMSGVGLTLVIFVLLLPSFIDTLMSQSNLSGLGNCISSPLSP